MANSRGRWIKADELSGLRDEARSTVSSGREFIKLE
jgi:hypothetical protein